MGNFSPHGFKSVEAFQEFTALLKSKLPSGIQPLFQGSSVTGRSYKTGEPFDVGRRSDFDVALAGQELFNKARALGLKAKDGTRIGPLSDAQLAALGLPDLGNELSRLAGRPVNFVLYDTVESAFKRAASLWVS